MNLPRRARMPGVAEVGVKLKLDWAEVSLTPALSLARPDRSQPYAVLEFRP